MIGQYTSSPVHSSYCSAELAIYNNVLGQKLTITFKNLLGTFFHIFLVVDSA